MARIESELLNYSSKYKYDNGVLINLLNIRDQNSLDKVERNLTNLKLSQLYDNPNLSLKPDITLIASCPIIASITNIVS